MNEIKRYPYSPILGWSFTRYETFSVCRRRYFYQYYAKYDPQIAPTAIERMKQLVSIPLEIGSIVHAVIETLLKRLQTTQTAIDQEKFFDFALAATHNSLQTRAFDEVYYGSQESINLDDLFPNVRSSLANFLQSPRFDWLCSQAEATAADWIIEPPGYGETRIEDLKAYIRFDFLIPLKDQMYIFDWKTGMPNPDKHRLQMVGYAGWATYQFAIPPQQVHPILVYLQPEYDELVEVFSDADLESFAIRVEAETQEMYDYLRDVAQNVPLPKSEFPLIEDQRICSYCSFRGLCYPERYPRFSGMP